MTDPGVARLTEYMSEQSRERRWPNVRPKDAATLILIDRGGPEPKVLMGKRHAGHKFMPGKYVFPGGSVEADDRRMPATGTIPARMGEALSARIARPAASRGRALAMAAIRETYEETGLMLGRVSASMPSGPAEGAWAAFFGEKVLPDLEPIRLVGRAITPPRRPKRFDTRFFAVDRDAIAAEKPGFVGPDKELVDLAWVDLEEARKLDLPPITTVMLEELERRIEAGFGHDLPVPFYYEQRRRFVREVL